MKCIKKTVTAINAINAINIIIYRVRLDVECSSMEPNSTEPVIITSNCLYIIEILLKEILNVKSSLIT